MLVEPQSIPKIIHYCWFGKKPYTAIQEMCISSWRKHLPDYEFRLWNEENVDMNHPFIAYAYKHKKWAFVSDYVRLQMLHDYGGIYLDTDMFLVKSLNFFLKDQCFVGAESDTLINAAIVGAKKGDLFIKKCLVYYQGQNFYKKHLNLAIPRVLTRALLDIDGFKSVFYEKRIINNVVVYPLDYFYPMPYDINKAFDKNFLIYKKDKTHAIHLWDGSWVEYSEFQLIRRKSYKEALIKVVKFPSQTRDFYYLKKIIITFFKSLIKNR